MRAVFLCPGVCHRVALQAVVLRCPRTHSGRASVLSGRSVRTVRTVGAHRRRFTDGHGRAALAAFADLARGAETGVHRCVRQAARMVPGTSTAGMVVGDLGAICGADPGSARPASVTHLSWTSDIPAMYPASADS
jgi:hypothetical protein